MHDFSHQQHALMVGALIFKGWPPNSRIMSRWPNSGLPFTFTAQGSSSTSYSTKHTVVATIDGSEIQRSQAQLAVEIPLPVQSGVIFYIPGGLRFLDHQQYHWKHDAVFFLLGQYFLNIHMSKGQNGQRNVHKNSHVPNDACTPGASNGCLRKQIYSRMRGLRPTPGG